MVDVEDAGISVLPLLKNPAPEISENGEPGQERELELELKVLADVGLVGFPSVGKSTLLQCDYICQTKKLEPIILQPSFQTWGWFGRRQVNPLQSQTFLD